MTQQRRRIPVRAVRNRALQIAARRSRQFAAVTAGDVKQRVWGHGFRSRHEYGGVDG